MQQRESWSGIRELNNVICVSFNCVKSMPVSYNRGKVDQVFEGDKSFNKCWHKKGGGMLIGVFNLILMDPHCKGDGARG